MTKINFQNLEKKIKIKFKNKDLLIKALTHKSYNREDNNEKIEFLGDRVLGLVMAKKLLEIYPNDNEGILDKKFAFLVNKKTCLEIAKKIQLQNYIKIHLKPLDTALKYYMVQTLIILRIFINY